MAETQRRICVVTTSRADYGLLRRLMQEIEADAKLELLTVVTGMHLAPEFGGTYRVVQEDAFRIHAEIEMLLSSDSDVGMAKSIGVGVLSFAERLRELDPDIVVLLGDRFELFSPAIAALMLRIPIAHIHGGETSQGAIDEAVRHSLTKMAAVHFPATEAYRRRILQMGEQPRRVFNFGAPGLDAVHEFEPPSRFELEARLQFSLSGTVALVTYHPVTLEPGQALGQVNELLDAITRTGIRAIFTKANADEAGRAINDHVKRFCAQDRERFRLYDNLGTDLYFGCMSHCTLMIGNSSSGLIEAPSFALPAVNIGERQKGRIRGANVIDVANSASEIEAGIRRACLAEFRENLSATENPYDASKDGGASRRIKDALKEIDLSAEILMKRFNDYPGGIPL